MKQIFLLAIALLIALAPLSVAAEPFPANNTDASPPASEVTCFETSERQPTNVTALLCVHNDSASGSLLSDITVGCDGSGEYFPETAGSDGSVTTTGVVSSALREVPLSDNLSTANLIIDTHEVQLFWNGTFIETMTYNVKESGIYTMLFRYWDAPLSFESSDQPYIEYVGISGPEDTIGYAKDHKGNIRTTVTVSPTDQSVISSQAFDNEVGFYKKEGFDQGIYLIQCRYIIHPPLEYDDKNAHLNLRLVDEHVPIQSLRIEVPAKPVMKIYCTPDTLHVVKDGNTLCITDTSLENGSISLEFLLQKEILQQMNGFPQFVPDIETKMDNAYNHSQPSYIDLELHAGFTADARSGSVPFTVQFTDLSTGNQTAWSWTFGDGATSTDQHPTHTYTAPGNYTVTLTVDGGLSTATKSDYIKVTPVLFGDAHEDGEVNQADTLLVLKQVVGLESKPDANTDPLLFQKTDVNQNRVIEVGDALFIAQYNVGLRDVWFELLE